MLKNSIWLIKISKKNFSSFPMAGTMKESVWKMLGRPFEPDQPWYQFPSLWFFPLTCWKLMLGLIFIWYDLRCPSFVWVFHWRSCQLGKILNAPEENRKVFFATLALTHSELLNCFVADISCGMEGMLRYCWLEIEFRTSLIAVWTESTENKLFINTASRYINIDSIYQNIIC